MAKYGIFNQPLTPGSKQATQDPIVNEPAGDYYGTGVRNRFGRVRADTVGQSPVPKKLLKVPPRSVV